MTAGLTLMKNLRIPLVKILLIPLGLSTGMSAADPVIQKKIYGSGTTALLISNGEMNDIMKIVTSLEESGLSIKGVSKTIKNEVKEQIGGILSMLLVTLGANLLGSLLTGTDTVRAGDDTIRPGQDF